MDVKAAEQELKKNEYIMKLLHKIAESDTWLRHSENFDRVCVLYGLRMNWRKMELEHDPNLG